MTDQWIAPETIFDGRSVLTGQAIRVQDGKVVDLAPAPSGALPIKGCVTPGFVDLQVNGGGGVMVNTTPTAAGLRAIATAHRHFGTVAMLPTVITDTPQVLERAAEAAIAAKGQDEIVGLHIEGPHIAVSRRGTHRAADIRDLDTHTLEIVARLRQHHVVVLMTLAPEAATLTQIAQLARMGVIVSIGHTDASADAVDGAIAAGARCATHLFNAMSPMISRAPGAVGAIINSGVPAGLICDGHHVDDRMISLALRARPAADLMFLVSDAMATVGGAPEFHLYGQSIALRAGRLVNAEGNLAGAHFTQRDGVRRLVENIGVPLEQALRMAVTVPAAVVGQDHLAQIVGRKTSDVLVLSDCLTTVAPLDCLGAVTPPDPSM